MGTISTDVEKDKKIAELMSGTWISFATTMTGRHSGCHLSHSMKIR